MANSYGLPASTLEWAEHAIINGVAGKKVFSVDSLGNVSTSGPMATKITVSGTITYVAKAAVATYIKNVIKGYRVNKARQSADVTIKQVSTSADGLVIQ